MRKKAAKPKNRKKKENKEKKEKKAKSDQTARTVTVEHAAKMLGIGRNNCYEAVKRGEIPSIRIRRRILISRAALEHLLGPPGTSPLKCAEAALDDPSRSNLRDPISEMRQ